MSLIGVNQMNKYMRSDFAQSLRDNTELAQQNIDLGNQEKWEKSETQEIFNDLKETLQNFSKSGYSRYVVHLLNDQQINHSLLILQFKDRIEKELKVPIREEALSYIFDWSESNE